MRCGGVGLSGPVRAVFPNSTRTLLRTTLPNGPEGNTAFKNSLQRIFWPSAFIPLRFPAIFTAQKSKIVKPKNREAAFCGNLG